jgi:phage I-like protein
MNKDASAPITIENDLTVWCQLAPLGEFPGMRGDEQVTQILDYQAFDQVRAAFAPEVLVDFEHRAENTDDTTAAAWIQELSTRDDGLWALLRFTDAGAEAVRGRRLRFLSPVWPLDPSGRPTRLQSAALTNTPNFNLRPVLNKAAGASTTQKGPKNMKELAALFGLPETATEAEILTAAKAAQDALVALQKRVDEMEAGKLKAEAQQVADANPTIANKAKFIDLYVANKAFALEVLATLAAQKTQVCNKAAAKKPADAFGSVQNKLAQYESMPDGKDKAAFLRAHAQEINDLRNARASAG